MLLPVESFCSKLLVLRATNVTQFGWPSYRFHSFCGLTAWEIWRLGTVHVIMGASSVGYTRLHIQPPIETPGDVVGLILDHVGRQEAVYETFATAERSGGPYPAAVDMLFCGKASSEGALQDPPSISRPGFSLAQNTFLGEIKVSCVPRLFHGVPGCGKTETVLEQISSLENQNSNTAIMCLRPTRNERDEFYVGFDERGNSNRVLSL